MALTDLTGTTWTLNSSLTSYAGGTYRMKTYSVNIETETALPAYGGDVDTFIAIRIGYESGNEYNQIRVYTSLPESYGNYSSLATGNDTKTLPDTWNNRYEKTFTFTGGTDATNSTLIAWVEDNCTQYVPPTPDVVMTYEGANIVELSEAGTKTLKTAGKYLTDDVVLAYSGGSGGGGGGVTTAHVTFDSVADSVWWTDASMVLQNNATIDAELPIGTLIVTKMSMMMPDGLPTGATLIDSGGSETEFYTIYQVTG